MGKIIFIFPTSAHVLCLLIKTFFRVNRIKERQNDKPNILLFFFTFIHDNRESTDCVRLHICCERKKIRRKSQKVTKKFLKQQTSGNAWGRSYFCII
jgi:hypothetical protein